jgi:hypothetical protein
MADRIICPECGHSNSKHRVTCKKCRASLVQDTGQTAPSSEAAATGTGAAAGQAVATGQKAARKKPPKRSREQQERDECYAFFLRTRTDERYIANYPMSATAGKLFIGTLLILAGMVGGGLAVRGLSLGWIAALIGGVIAGVIVRKTMLGDGTNPLDQKRWASFGLVFLGTYWVCWWLLLFVVILPASLGGNLAQLRLALYLIPAAPGLVLGALNLFRADKKHKADMLAHLEAWKKSRT